MLALPLQDVPSDSPAARGLPAAEQSPGPLAPTDESHLPKPTDPPRLPQSSVARSVVEVGLRAGAARRPAHPTLDRLVGTSRTSARGVPDMPAVRLAARFRQGAAAGHPPGHRLRRPVSPADTRQWLAGRRTWRTSRPSGRPDIPVQGERPADGYRPGPDSDGQAADTSTAQRPTIRLTSRPRPT